MQKCFQCENENPDGQTFCGSCGAALNFSAFVAERVKVELATAIKDRNVLELESSVKVFERVWGWMKLIAGAVGIIIAIGTVYFAWNLHDLRTIVAQAENTVTKGAADAREEIGKTSSASIKTIQQAAIDATTDSQKASHRAVQLSGEMEATAKRTNAQLRSEAASLKQSVAVSQAALSSANKLRPDIEALRSQMATTTAELNGQKKLLSSSEDLAKQILSSRVQAVFGFDSPTKLAQPLTAPVLASPVYGIAPPPAGSKSNRTTVYMLLPSAPIPNTVQLQFYLSVQPAGSFYVLHNLVIFSWGDPAENIKQHEMTVGYFPDNSDKALFKSLILKDGQFLADGQVLPRL